MRREGDNDFPFLDAVDNDTDDDDNNSDDKADEAKRVDPTNIFIPPMTGLPWIQGQLGATNVERFGHGHFGLGCFGLGHFGQAFFQRWTFRP